MGLLDDAIREHLELKRLRGADPGEVAREQREALEAVPRDAEAAPAAAVAELEAPGMEPIGDEQAAGASVPPELHSRARPITGAGAPVRAPQPGLAEPSEVIQETAELDMRAVLDAEMDSSKESSAAQGPVAVRAPTAETDEDPSESSTEWEVPGDVPGGTAQNETRRQRRRRERGE